MPQASDSARSEGRAQIVEQIRRAVARGWCHGPNGFKTFDIDLAEAITDEVRRLFDSLLEDAGLAARGPKSAPQKPLALSYCMQELKSYIDNVIAERGREHALSFLSLTRMESIIRETVATAPRESAEADPSKVPWPGIIAHRIPEPSAEVGCVVHDDKSADPPSCSACGAIMTACFGCSKCGSFTGCTVESAAPEGWMREAAREIHRNGHNGKSCAYCSQCPICGQPSLDKIVEIIRKHAVPATEKGKNGD